MENLKVTLHMFSGMPDPKWEIDESHESHGKIMSNILLLDGRPDPAEKFDGLGYKGFTVETKNRTFRIYKQAFKELEHMLIRTRKQTRDRTEFVADDVFDHVVESIGRTPECKETYTLPDYNPRIWNTPNVQPYNNCYDYANNMITNTFAQPGRASGHTIHFPQDLTGPTIEKYATSDNLEACEMTEYCGNLVALVIWPGNDFHWYRKDSNNLFSHKPGQTEVRDVDNSGNKIKNPETCDRGPYTEVVSFMATFPDLVIIK